MRIFFTSFGDRLKSSGDHGHHWLTRAIYARPMQKLSFYLSRRRSKLIEPVLLWIDVLDITSPWPPNKISKFHDIWTDCDKGSFLYLGGVRTGNQWCHEIFMHLRHEIFITDISQMCIILIRLDPLCSVARQMRWVKIRHTYHTRFNSIQFKKFQTYIQDFI